MTTVVAVTAAVQRWLLGLMLACYVLAGVLPGPGETLRGLALRMPVGASALSLPMLLLAMMLFNAGLGVRITDLRGVVCRPARLVLGIAVNALLPLLVLPAVARSARSGSTGLCPRPRP
ncbi:hypothetical protein ACFYWU_16565 [Streptomyces chrestomyceticus]|uniref:hypothetical protein n=1 Tax=Streptomyces chrestomyceticus TaxID=68185 RepID=UPI0036AD24E5